MSTLKALNAKERGKPTRSARHNIAKATVALSSDRKTLSIRIPMKVAVYGGRKSVITPPGASPWSPLQHPAASATLKAIARAFRWRKLLETGLYASIGEMATAEKINPSYVSRVLRLTLLAPDIVERVLEGQHTAYMNAGDLLVRFPIEWERQRLKV